MADKRYEILAENLINYSVNLQKGENILIEVTGKETELTCALINAAYRAGGNPFLHLQDSSLQRNWLMQVNDDQLKMQAEWEAQRMNAMQAYIGIRIKDNSFELADVPAEKMEKYETLLQKPVHHDIRVCKTKWVILRYPNPSMAQEARMSTEAFRDFYFDVCNLDYAKMSRAMTPLQDLMNKTDKVHIIAPGTDLSFSIKGIGAVKCDGKCNIPDGEVYSAPVKDSVEGYITYNAPSVNQGKIFNNIRLEFSQGKIVKASCDNDSEALNRIFDTDPGARYVGEFSFGFNPYILHPINDILFDEKIAGSIHFTPGSCYEDAFNGNSSAVHWDLVSIHRPEYGGGEIYFDGELIRKDGLFVKPELFGLNPENLK